VDRLSLSVPQGSIYGILGANGAGKSTTLRMVMNIIARDSGSIRVLGVDPAVDRTVLRRVGYLPEERGLYKKMTVRDVIVFFGELRGMPESVARQKGLGWLEKMGLLQPVPRVEIAVSLALMLCGIAIVAWIAGKIYRVGILSTGKRPSLSELARWVRSA
jgi:ABC-type uncharacterized transport system ATPase subunit